METWPDFFPAPQMKGFEISPGDAVLRTQGDGPAEQRRRTAQPSEPVQAVFRMDDDVMSVFEGFYRWALFDGAAWFNLPLAVGAAVMTFAARFVGPYDAKLRGRRWEVRAQLELQQ